MPDNFHLAPPVKLVDGLTAVPIDIQSIAGALTFDGAAQTGVGDVTLNFIMGPQDGHPIFDLRQTLSGAWLDGAPIALSSLAQHDFGGGPQAELRVVQSSLTAGSAHTLRVTYSLGIPQASAAGSYQPNIAWSAGPRLVFNFGFTDLGPGRYLEAWVPANLIFDQFSVDLEVSLLSTAIAHSVITNAQITLLGANHWQLHWPATSSALSTLLEVRATDSVTLLTDSVTLPVSGVTVSVEAWKLNGGSANLVTQMNDIKTHLAANENSVGAYLHGTRFVAFFNLGGMEYDGATTTGTGALKHETFHSWFGRGVKPAGQPDGWWDEAWTVYSMNGAVGSTPFNFSNPPVELCTRNPWSRVTPQGAYSSGELFFEGLAALAGAPALGNFMDAFYAEYKGRPVPTAELEAHLLKKMGKSTVVDGFHRFVYGFGDPLTAPDLWLKDDTGHTGSDSWGGAFWDSPDLWVRHSDDGGLTHENPEYGQDNWIHARVRNRGGSAQHFAVTFNVKSFAGVEFVYPDDFLPATAAQADFDLSGGATRIVKVRWPRALVPPEGSHPCLLAAAMARGDQPISGRHVWEHNNLAQKNLTIVDLAPNDWIVIPFVIVNRLRDVFPWFELAVLRPRRWQRVASALLHPQPRIFSALPLHSRDLRARLAQKKEDSVIKSVLDCAGESAADMPGNLKPWTSRNPQARLAARFQDVPGVPFSPGRSSRQRVSIPFGDQLLVGWRVQVPHDAKPGESFKLHLVKRNWFGCKAHGGIALEIHVTGE